MPKLMYSKKRNLIGLMLFSMFLMLYACKTEEILPVQPPGVEAGVISQITQSSATMAAKILTDGSGRIKVSGVCWGIKPGPTVEDNKTTNGPTEGSYKALITGLAPYTTYYARPYATNDAGTVYGNEVQFKTTQELVELVTLAVTDITGSTAKSGGQVIRNGETITEKGICWSESGEPTIDNNKTSEGATNADFVSTMQNLTPGITYRVRAYAINSGGVGYGNTVQFSPPMPTVTDIDGNVYHSIRIGDQVWMAENLKVRHFLNGDPITYLNPNDPYLEPYGYLYFWTTAVDPRGIAPEGWRVASDDDWMKLNIFLGENPGGKLKALDRWAAPNTGATNTYGFNAYGGGLDNSGTRQAVNQTGYWWTSSAANATDGLRWEMGAGGGYLGRTSNNGAAFKMSIRLIKK